tara:strand:+ start:3823 stop:4779 length:957 start_codon:yes stop_codon:yes gene_type:complete
MNKHIYCTLGPSTLNKKFLKYASKKVNLLRLNMSHIDIKNLQKNINYVKKYSKVQICIDTEGAQIRSKVLKEKIFKKNKILEIYKSQKNKFCLYPSTVFDKLKKKDILDIGFEGLKVQIRNIKKDKCICKVKETGKLENNKGIYITNRKIKLKYLTSKDYKAIEIAKKNKIRYFALSFVNSHKDIINFNKILKDQIKIFKIETSSAIKNLNKIIKYGDNFLIDRGDLSKEIGIENIPVAQRKILKLSNKRKKNVYIATNFLESMISKSSPTRAEVNDIYNALELGAKGIVLAAETAIGNYPKECIELLRKIFKIFKKN